MSKLLTVFGATGQQGGALIDHIIENPHLSSLFSLRGITRDASKPAAIALKNRGVEIVEADLNIPSTLDKAVAGSYVVFGVTNFWEQASADVEISQGKAIADASVAAGVTQIIWSSLPGDEGTAGGKPTVPTHFASKAKVETYIRTLDIKSMFYMPGWFMQNHLEIIKPQKMDDGTYEFSMPWDPSSVYPITDIRDPFNTLPLIDIRDTGKFIEPALLDPNRYHGKRFTCATAFYTFADMAATWTKVTGKTVKFQTTPDTVDYSKLPEERRIETEIIRGNLSVGYFGSTGRDDLAWTLEQISGKLTTWEDFVRENEPWFED